MNMTDLDSFKQDHGYISVDPLEGFISIPSGFAMCQVTCDKFFFLFSKRGPGGKLFFPLCLAD